MVNKAGSFHEFIQNSVDQSIAGKRDVGSAIRGIEITFKNHDAVDDKLKSILTKLKNQLDDYADKFIKYQSSSWDKLKLRFNTLFKSRMESKIQQSVKELQQLAKKKGISGLKKDRTDFEQENEKDLLINKRKEEIDQELAKLKNSSIVKTRIAEFGHTRPELLQKTKQALIKIDQSISKADEVRAEFASHIPSLNKTTENILDNLSRIGGIFAHSEVRHKKHKHTTSKRFEFSVNDYNQMKEAAASVVKQCKELKPGSKKLMVFATDLETLVMRPVRQKKGGDKPIVMEDINDKNFLKHFDKKLADIRAEIESELDDLSIPPKTNKDDLTIHKQNLIELKEFYESLPSTHPANLAVGKKHEALFLINHLRDDKLMSNQKEKLDGLRDMCLDLNSDLEEITKRLLEISIRKETLEVSISESNKTIGIDV